MMQDENKNKKQLFDELNFLREKINELETERDRFDKIFNYSQDAIFIVYPEENKILDANPAACDKLGFSRDELLSLSISAIHPEEMEQFLSFCKLVRKEGSGWTNELTCKTKDNTFLPTEMSASYATINGKACMIAIVRDISERKKAEKNLRESEETYRDLFESAFDVVFMVDKNKNFVDINHRAEVLTGYSKKELLEMHAYDLVHPQDWQHFDDISAALASGKEIMFEIRWVAKDKTIIHFEGASTPRFAASGEFLSTRCTLRDISERVKAEDRCNLQLQRLTSLNKIDRAITASMDLPLILDTVLDQIVATLEIDAVGILLLDPRTKAFEFVNGYGFKTEAIQNATMRLGEGLAGQAAYEQRVISIPKLQESSSDIPWSEFIQFIQGEGFVSYHAIPLIAKGAVKGIMEIFHREEFLPGKDWLDFLETLGRQTAIAIENVELFNSLQHTSTELIHAYDSTLEGWVQALDLRDEETEGHSRRVVELTLVMAHKMDIDEDQIDHVRRGALLHDIGKMGVPDAILQKPGKLTDEEWKIIQQHPVYAFEWLSTIKYLQPALDIPYCHHEKWDGTGYPRGLKGLEIPIAARIFSIIDVWDALRSDRPYRKALSQEKTLTYIQEQSGTHFDPKVVEAFLKLIIDNPDFDFFE